MLGVPLFGADPRHLPHGTKSGCRRLFAEEGVPHPLGYEDIDGLQSLLVAGLARLRSERPRVSEAIVKLNVGRIRQGETLIVDLREPPPLPCVPPARSSELERRVRTMTFELRRSCPFEAVRRSNLAERRGVVEERYLAAPSCGARASSSAPRRRAGGALSTHDQLLGGPSGQSYLGCRFPADSRYAKAITREAAKIGARLSREGVIGRFAVDFVVVRDQSDVWTPYAIEINLRKGGTTHPFLTLQFLTGGNLRSGHRALHRPQRAREASRRHGSSRVAALSRTDALGPLRRGRAARPPIRPVSPNGRRLPHDDGAERVRRRRADGCQRQRR